MHYRMGITVLEIVSWGDKSSVLWLQMAFYGFADASALNRNFRPHNRRFTSTNFLWPFWWQLSLTLFYSADDCLGRHWPMYNWANDIADDYLGPHRPILTIVWVDVDLCWRLFGSTSTSTDVYLGRRRPLLTIFGVDIELCWRLFVSTSTYADDYLGRHRPMLTIVWVDVDLCWRLFGSTSTYV